jgi:predicted kinase
MKPLSLALPHLIVMVGIPGSGKSFFAEHFASTFNAPYVSFSELSYEIFGQNSPDTAVTAKVSNYVLGQLLKTGQTVVYEGPTEIKSVRIALVKIAKDNGYNPLLVWVQTESAAAKIRATKKQTGKTYLNDEQFDTILRRFTPPSSTEKAIVISGKHTYASQLRIVLKRLSMSRTERIEQAPVQVDERRHITIR